MDTTEIDCVCCKLPARVRDVVGQNPSKVCDDCMGHLGPKNTTAMALDHATVYWERMEDAARDAEHAHRRADSALHTRDQAIGWLRSIRDDHWMGVEKCSCGRTECRTGDLLASGGPTRLIQATQRRQPD